MRTNKKRLAFEDPAVRPAERDLVREKIDEARTRISFPLVPSGHPGALRSLTNAKIDKLPD